ncbi:hypothetical protein DOU02_06705 [Clavibacter michiganensis subsp. michiganensis]|uniref:hypothetical protein n=1 Tax=Clavibacter michiganensis TaxID=28447 RepID=UPI0013039F18|nr:hypothetical protein [Clavibacter michiganensis]KAF0258768.1 hypothetical protein DOU02_06705 [Clavibacter michiganensis subsp. michiganensis]
MSDESSWEEDETPDGFGPFYVGDTPAVPFELDLTEDPFVVALGLDNIYLKAGVELAGPLPSAILGSFKVVGGRLSIIVPEDIFGVGGIYQLRITLSEFGPRKRLDPIEIVVEDEASGWHTLASARSQWADAVQLSHAQLWTFLDAARTAVTAFAPPSSLRVRPSASLRTAQLLHARALWNATSSDNNGTTADGFGGIVTVRPLDGTVKALIRPKRGIPGVA